MTPPEHPAPEHPGPEHPGPERALSEGTLLDGRLRYAQPVEGYRTGLEPVLLAASVPARPGQRVLEAGTGAGAGLMCLMRRVPDLVGTGMEIDPAMARVARGNLAANGLDAAIHVRDVAEATGLGPVDHAFANPPWHDPAGTRPCLAARDRAKHLTAAGLAPWIHGLATLLAPRGTLSLALPATRLAEAMALLQDVGFGSATVLPLWPRHQVAAKLLLLQARHGRAGTRLLPGLVLHEGDGLSVAAEAVLRAGEALRLA